MGGRQRGSRNRNGRYSSVGALLQLLHALSSPEGLAIESIYFVELEQKLLYKLKGQARINISRVMVVDGRQCVCFFFVWKPLLSESL